MISGVNFNPREYLNKEDDGCLIRSVRAIMDFSGYGNHYHQIIKDLIPGRYGFDFIGIAESLAEANLLLELGLYDTDYIPVLKVGERLDFRKLSHFKNQTTNLRNGNIESLESIIKFASKYNSLLKIERTSYSRLKTWLVEGYPICLHVRLGTLYKTDCDVIHAQVVYALDEKSGKIYIWDPDVGFLTYKAKIFFHGWWDAGGYYLVIKSKGKDSLPTERLSSAC